jgi:hypothetical protein
VPDLLRIKLGEGKTVASRQGGGAYRPFFVLLRGDRVFLGHGRPRLDRRQSADGEAERGIRQDVHGRA